MAQTYAPRLVRRAAVARDRSRGDDIARDRRSVRARANLVLVVAWAALAVAIAVHAIDHASIGAGAFAVLVVSLLAAPWRVAVGDEEPRAQIAFA
jgi:hypothetical protein